jgi:hypothetical protein
VEHPAQRRKNVYKKLTDLNFSVYRLTLEARERIELPRINKGITLRGAFGTVFRRLVCHDLRADCNKCLIGERCPYKAVFSPTVPEDAKRLRLNRDIPRPFVIKPLLDEGDTYQPGRRLCFDLVVVGKAQEYLPYFIVTFEELGRQGIGTGRGRYRMDRLEALNTKGRWSDVYDAGDRMVRPPGETLTFAALAGSDMDDTKSLCLEFLTPVLLKEKGQWVKPAFGVLVKRLRDRINALSYFYCGEPMEMDFKAFGNQAEAIRTVTDGLKWVEENRYSRHRGLKHVLKGYVGKISFEGEIGPFMPILKLGEFLHVGKATAFGQGWYKIKA